MVRFFIISIVILFFPLASVAQQATPPIQASKDTILKERYQQCLASEHPIYTRDDLGFFCSCEYAGYTAMLNEPQVVSGAFETNPVLRDRLLFDVYLRCTQDTLYEHVLNVCLGTMQSTPEIKRPIDVCECNAEEMSDLIEVQGLTLLQKKIFAQEENLSRDPLAYFFGSFRYAEILKYHLTDCTQRKEFGWYQDTERNQ